MPSNLNLDYYYGNEAEQYSFYRVPKTLLTDPRFKSVSIEAKVLYGLLLDRMGLSVRNGWMDNARRVYIYFTQEDAMTLMNCGKDKATKLFRELDQDGIGLIERKKQGQGRPTRIYVKNFTLPPEPGQTPPNMEPIPPQGPCANAQTAENQRSRPLDSAALLTAEKPQSAPLETRGQDSDFSVPNKTDKNKTDFTEAVLKEGTTSPPSHFSEDTLLSAMEHASAEDFAKLEDVERKGLGTPATRAGVIEKLVRSGFVERKGKQIIPTQKGVDLIRVMPDQLKSAKLIAEWEERLGAVERGEMAPDDFTGGIVEMVRDLVQTYAHVTVASAALSQSGRAVIGKCPRCGKSVVEGKKSFFCEGYYDKPPCGFALWKNDRFFTGKRKELTKKTAASLLKNGRVAMTGLFSEKKGTFYNATVVMDDDGGKFVRFKLEFDNKRKGR